MADDWDKLEKIHKKAASLAEKYKGLKKKIIAALMLTAGLTSSVPMAVLYNLVNDSRKAEIQPKVDEYIQNAVAEIGENYPRADICRQVFNIQVYDKASMDDYLFKCFSQSFTIDFSNFHPVEGVYEYTLPHIVYPEWQTFYDEYVTTHFNYIFEGIDAIYESVRYSMLDAAKDALPFTVGALALVGGYYAVKIRKCQKEIEQVNQEIWKHEDKLFWNK